MDIEVVASLRSGEFRARIVDYSVIGLGVVIDDSEAPVQKGDAIAVGIDTPGLYETGKVAWTSRTPGGLRIGILKIDPFRGLLDLYPLCDLLIGLQRTLKTGVLEVRKGIISKRVFISNGTVVWAKSNDEKDRLGDILLKSRKIGKRQYEKAAEMKKKTGSSYISILLHMRYLSSDKVLEARKLQTRKIIASLFLIRGGEFEFIENIRPPEDDFMGALSISDVVYRWLKKNADVRLIETYLMDSLVDSSGDSLNLFQNFSLPQFDRLVLSRVDGKTTIRGLVDSFNNHNPARIYRIVFALLETRVLKIVGQDGATDDMASLLRTFEQSDDAVSGLLEDRISWAFVRDESDKNEFPLSEEDFEMHAAHGKSISEQSLANPMAEIDKSTETVLESDANVSDSGTHPSEAKKNFMDGRVAFWDKDFQTAARLFSTALKLCPTVAEYHYMFGCALARLKKYREAAQALNWANELQADDADILAELGNVYLELGFPLRAKRFFSQAVKINSSHKSAKDGLNKVG